MTVYWTSLRDRVSNGTRQLLAITDGAALDAEDSTSATTSDSEGSGEQSLSQLEAENATLREALAAAHATIAELTIELDDMRKGIFSDTTNALLQQRDD